jgi:hypothetical protein
MFMDRRLNTVRMSVLPNLSYRFTAIQIRILENYFVNINKLILKDEGLRIVNTILKKNNKVGRLTPFNF